MLPTVTHYIRTGLARFWGYNDINFRRFNANPCLLITTWKNMKKLGKGATNFFSAWSFL